MIDLYIGMRTWFRWCDDVELLLTTCKLGGRGEVTVSSESLSSRLETAPMVLYTIVTNAGR